MNALLKAKLVIDPELQQDAQSTQDSGYDATVKLIKSGLKFDAIFAASDLMALGAIKALNDHKLQVPDDVALVGFDDIPITAYTRPPLTTVHQDTILAGELLVENLIRTY